MVGGGVSHLTVVVPPFPDCSPGGADRAGSLCLCAGLTDRLLVPGPIHYSIQRARTAFPFAPPGGITNLEMQSHFGVLRY